MASEDTVTQIEQVKPMTTEMLEGIKVIELNWHASGKFKPPVGFKLYEALQNDSFRRALANRGIKLPRSEEQEELEASLGHPSLTQQQTAAVLTVVNFSDKRSRNVKLRELGISVSTWNGWLKDESFRDYYFNLANQQFAHALPVAQESLIRAMESGKVEGIKFYMDLMGKGPSSSEASGHNVRMVLQKLIEVLQLHIRDPELLGAIGIDFDRVLKGESPVGPQNALVQSGVL